MMKDKDKEKPVTLIDVVSARFEKISQAREEGNRQTRQRIKELEAERAPLLAKRDDLSRRVGVMTAEYCQLLTEVAAEEKKRIEEADITDKDLAAGRISGHDFMRFGKKHEEVQAEAKLAAEEKLGKVRDAVRSIRLELYAADLELADLAEKIGFQVRQIGEIFFFQLSSMRQELINAGVGGAAAQFLHSGAQTARNDWNMAAKGANLSTGKIWKIKNVEEAELLSLDPIVQVGHLGELREFINSNLKSRDFTEASVTYSPSDLPGRPAGFWLMSMKNLR